jgi:hypothetical protein
MVAFMLIEPRAAQRACITAPHVGCDDCESWSDVGLIQQISMDDPKRGHRCLIGIDDNVFSQVGKQIVDENRAVLWLCGQWSIRTVSSRRAKSRKLTFPLLLDECFEGTFLIAGSRL